MWKTDLRDLYAGINRERYLRTGQLIQPIKRGPHTKLYKGHTYRGLQHRNSVIFNYLSKEKQQQLRELGYNNVGWKNVKESWRIMWRFFNK